MTEINVLEDADEHTEEFIITHRFDPVWCEQFFQLSGDNNRTLHDPKTGIVQGVAVLTIISMYASRMPGKYFAGWVGDGDFVRPIRPGESVTICLMPDREESTPRFELIRCKLFSAAGKQIFRRPIAFKLGHIGR